MKPELIITQIERKSYCFTPHRTVDFINFPAELGYTLEIQVTGNGCFDKYVKGGMIDHCKISKHILNGDLPIVGIK